MSSFLKWVPLYGWLLSHKNGWRGYGEEGTLLHCWWECKWIQTLWRTVWRFLKTVGIKLPCMRVKLLQLCLTFCNPIDCSLPGSSVHGILQAGSWSGLPCPPPGDLPDPGTEPASLMSLHWQEVSLPLAPPERPHKLPYDPKIPLRGLYSEKIITEKDTCSTIHCNTIYNS